MEEPVYILEAQGLHKSFGRPPAREHVLRGLDMRVRRGEFLAVMGPSGCGKSTLLHLLGLMATPDAGEVRIGGRAVSGLGEADRARVRRERIGFVFQRFNLISVLSGYDNVFLNLRIRGMDDDGRIRELLEAL
ncbi:MAG: ABC transporter ATP-binding protein, partial [Planctomycetota bacterium]